MEKVAIFFSSAFGHCPLSVWRMKQLWFVVYIAKWRGFVSPLFCYSALGFATINFLLHGWCVMPTVYAHFYMFNFIIIPLCSSMIKRLHKSVFIFKDRHKLTQIIVLFGQVFVVIKSIFKSSSEKKIMNQYSCKTTKTTAPFLFDDPSKAFFTFFNNGAQILEFGLFAFFKCIRMIKTLSSQIFFRWRFSILDLFCWNWPII